MLFHVLPFSQLNKPMQICSESRNEVGIAIPASCRITCIYIHLTVRAAFLAHLVTSAGYLLIFFYYSESLRIILRAKIVL